MGTRSRTLLRGAGAGAAIAPTRQRITPAGRQTALGDLPLAEALSPDGRTLLVSNDGQGVQSLQVIYVPGGRVVQTLPSSAPRSLFVGLAFSPDGRRAYASGGGDQKIHRFDVQAQRLTELTAFALPTTAPGGTKINAFPAAGRGLGAPAARQGGPGRREELQRGDLAERQGSRPGDAGPSAPGGQRHRRLIRPGTTGLDDTAGSHSVPSGPFVLGVLRPAVFDPFTLRTRR